MGRNGTRGKKSIFLQSHRGEKGSFWHTSDEAPEWVKNLCHTAHKVDDVMPNDYVYEYIVDALDLIGEMEGADRLSEFEESIFEIEGDIYNADLLQWVASNLSFSSYVDEAMNEYGAKEHFNALQIGNALHKQAIARSVLDSINEQAEEIEE